MIKVLVAYLAALAGSLGPSLALAVPQPVVIAEINLPEMMRFACVTLEYDCTDVPMPKVELVPLYRQYGALGVYFPGGDTIYLDSDLLPFFNETAIQSVFVHEMTHYVDHVVIGDEAMQADKCATEGRAWRIGNAWLVVHGRADLADFTWYERYNCYV